MGEVYHSTAGWQRAEPKLKSRHRLITNPRQPSSTISE
jgi:hypothetical protein